MLDADLALIYGVRTKRLNEQVRRNPGRFPSDFMFQLTAAEKAEVVAKCDHLQGLKFAASAPFAFTEHGAVMLAAVLNSPRAVAASVAIARAFVRLRRMVVGRRELAVRIRDLERRVGAQDGSIKELFEALGQLTDGPPPPARRIGF